ncbi:hypothetical protein CYY_008723 [Polysphondylium violaceum]|uniref:Uncharacterized protein n=1 Tax=Polysphondylium violaceum TaxID=133409 RepID=A0A8J4V3N1_9MYCE|nr:hypothetical protein CYY_008723 [Polysphondylium violaceum]
MMVVPLPILILKQILENIYYQDQHEFQKFGKKEEFIWTLQYALVSKQWFAISKQLNNINTCLPIDVLEKSYTTNYNSEFRLMAKESIHQLAIRFIDMDKYIEIVNCQYRSVLSITILHNDFTSGWIDNSLWYLNHLNKLERKDHIVVNFDFSLMADSLWNACLGQAETRVPLKFKANHFKVTYDCDGDEGKTYGYIYQVIKDVSPKTLEFISGASSDGGAGHLKIFHSLSKLDHQYQSIEIKHDYLPLYSLYRFLQSPTLHIFKFNLQFHFLSALYDDNENDGDFIYNLCSMDNFEYRDFEFDTHYEFQRETCRAMNVNEDNQVYCTFDRYGDSNPTIPSYSKQLWKQCLQLVANNKTITEFSIGETQCGEECFGNNESMNQQLIDDLLESLSNNQSIKTLYLNTNTLINKEFILALVQRNSTLHSIYLGSPYVDHNQCSALLDDLSQSMPSNSKCVLKNVNLGNDDVEDFLLIIFRETVQK